MKDLNSKSDETYVWELYVATSEPIFEVLAYGPIKLTTYIFW